MKNACKRWLVDENGKKSDDHIFFAVYHRFSNRMVVMTV
jgi:hypothetical protein